MGSTDRPAEESRRDGNHLPLRIVPPAGCSGVAIEWVQTEAYRDAPLTDLESARSPSVSGRGPVARNQRSLDPAVQRASPVMRLVVEPSARGWRARVARICGAFQLRRPGPAAPLSGDWSPSARTLDLGLHQPVRPGACLARPSGRQGPCAAAPLMRKGSRSSRTSCVGSGSTNSRGAAGARSASEPCGIDEDKVELRGSSSASTDAMQPGGHSASARWRPLVAA